MRDGEKFDKWQSCLDACVLDVVVRAMLFLRSQESSACLARPHSLPRSPRLRRQLPPGHRARYGKHWWKRREGRLVGTAAVEEVAVWLAAGSGCRRQDTDAGAFRRCYKGERIQQGQGPCVARDGFAAGGSKLARRHRCLGRLRSWVAGPSQPSHADFNRRQARSGGLEGRTARSCLCWRPQSGRPSLPVVVALLTRAIEGIHGSRDNDTAQQG